MSIGIIGSGALGFNIARALAKNRIHATISNSRGPDSLGALVSELGSFIAAGTVEEAASADIVFAAIRWTDAEAVMSRLPAWGGRIVVDGTNPVEFLDPDSPDADDSSNPLAVYGIKEVDLGNMLSSEMFSQFVPGARVVKAFNHLVANDLREPDVAGGKRVLFYSGDDADAKAEVRKIIENIGFYPVDLGSLHVGGMLVSLSGSLSNQNLVKI